MMEEVFLPVLIVGILFLGLPWLIFHYVTQWKRSGSMTVQDENLLDELHDLARRLEDRMNTIERIVAADSPGFRPAPAPRLPRAGEDDFDTLADDDREPTRSRRR